VTPVIFLLTDQPTPYVLYTVIGGFLVLWRHRENACALAKGTERKIGQKDAKDVSRVR
jgi:acyl phosphate:glycerol-3-phosphate acyltransferase